MQVQGAARGQRQDLWRHDLPVVGQDDELGLQARQGLARRRVAQPVRRQGRQAERLGPSVDRRPGRDPAASSRPGRCADDADHGAGEGGGEGLEGGDREGAAAEEDGAAPFGHASGVAASAASTSSPGRDWATGMRSSMESR